MVAERIVRIIKMRTGEMVIGILLHHFVEIGKRQEETLQEWI